MSHTRTQRMLFFSRSIAGVILLMLILGSAAFVFVLKTKEFSFSQIETATSPVVVPPFPVGVDTHQKIITEQPSVSAYLFTHFAYEKPKKKISWLRSLEAKLLTKSWYQNLASGGSRILVIYAGQRKEEVIDTFGDILHWDTAARLEFAEYMMRSYPTLTEGTFFPGKYLVSKDATPQDVATLLQERFEENIMKRYTAAIASLVTLETTLTVASLLEREAYTFDDMRIISGVIWQRLFSDMKLQLDATLQYAKGSEPQEPHWWPHVLPEHKYVDSPYNTYQNAGLPPAPIANPSAAAVLAALNPIDTPCRFYFHDTQGTLHCSEDYEMHVQQLKRIYGRGQ